MILQGQGAVVSRRAAGDRGYAMVALLVGLSVMAILMTAMLPVWSQTVQREKEEELIFRGQQYARAIGLFQRKFANTAPPTIDVLVEQRFLRKKYKDPITNDDFQPLYANQAPQGVGTPAGSRRPGQTGDANQAVAPAPAGGGLSQGQGNVTGGLIGVTSKSKEASIKIYNGRSKYNEWAFVFVQTSQRPGGTGAQTPGQPGGRPTLPGQGQTPSMGGPAGSQGAPRPPVGFPGQPFGAPQPGSAPRRPGA